MRWLVRIGIVVVAAVAIVLGGILLLPGERIARIAADQIEARTGRSLQIGGDVSISLWPVLGIRTGPVQLSNADWAGPDPMLTADSLEIGVALPALLQRDIHITKIRAQQPVLRLQTAPDGRGNWELGAPGDPSAVSVPATPDTGAGQMPVTLELLELKRATLVYAAAQGDPIILTDTDLTLRWPDPDAAAEIAVVLRPAGQPISIAAQISQPAAFLQGAVVPVQADLAAPGGAVAFQGRAAMAGDAAGRLTVQGRDMAAMLAGFGLAGTVPPQGLGRSAEITTDVTYTADGRLALREITAKLDQNRLSGAADILLTGVPQITAQLQAGVLDLAPAGTGAGAGDAAAAPGTTGDGWSKAPIDASALGLANAEISLTLQGLRTPDLSLGSVQARLALERSRAVLHLDRVSVFKGNLSGRLVANNRKGFSVGGKLKARDIDILAAQRALLGFERIQGQAAGELQFLGSGGSVDAIMRSLSGAGALRMGRGVILGVDLDQLMRRGSGSGGTTVFDSLTASWTMQGGNLQNDDLLLSLKNYRADGAGRVGLGARDINYQFTPVALRAKSGQGVSIPIRIKGPWTAVRIQPDLEAAAKARADKELKALEEDAKAKLQQKLERELDVKVAPDQDAKEVLKDKLEDEAKSQLLKLLGRD
ncbi:AsmA family protein [Sedimentitalea sp. HM32M-2]|uniref:AsmA family protein n=1 Tax=Sedimentitalea sp. HM32M-2 TaxID=3351566 RepID=UPI00363D90A1